MTRATSFKKVVLCHTNDFNPDVNDKIKTWVEVNGGTFTKEVTADVTHLVASKKAWKRYHPIVRQARRMRTIKIVNYDWLEDSLMKKPARALPEDKYLYEQLKLKKIKKIRNAAQSCPEETSDQVSRKMAIPRDKKIEVAGIEYDKARKEFEEDMATAGFHPYVDSTGFVYIITLLRHDIFRNRFEKHRLKLYESDKRPHTYACYNQYTRPGIQKHVLVLAPPGSTWEFTWASFEKFFVRKVNIAWDERPCNGTDINLDGEKEWFQYQAPNTSEPEGLRRNKQRGEDLMHTETFVVATRTTTPSDDMTCEEEASQAEVTTTWTTMPNTLSHSAISINQ